MNFEECVRQCAMSARLREDAMKVCDVCGESMRECTCEEYDVCEHCGREDCMCGGADE